MFQQCIAEGVFFQYRLIAPAARTVELGDHTAAIFHTYGIDAVFVAVERVDTSVSTPADTVDGVQYLDRIKRLKGERCVSGLDEH